MVARHMRLLVTRPLCLQASGRAAKASKENAPNPAKGKPSKKGKDGPSFGLGKGSPLIRSLIHSTATQWAPDPDSSQAKGHDSTDGASSDTLTQVVQLARQLQSSGEEEAGQASVPETLGEAAEAVGRRTVMQLQQALKVRPLQSGCLLHRPYGGEMSHPAVVSTSNSSFLLQMHKQLTN